MDLIIRVLCIFAIVFVGLLAAKFKWLSLDSSKYLSSIVINIAAPCVIISSLAGERLDKDSLKATAIVFGLFFLMYFFVTAISGPLTSLLRIKGQHRGIYKNFFMLTNNGFLGIPVASIIFSTTGVFYLVIGNIVMNFFIYSFSILNIIHSNPQSKSKSAKPKVRDILKELFNLPMVSSLLGLCIFLIQIPLPKDLFFLLDTLGAMMAPLAMMVIGIQLLNSNLKKLVINHKLILMSAFRLLIIPGTIFAILFVFYSFGLIDRLQVSIVTLNWAFPCAAMGVILAEQYNSDVLFASEGTFLSTFFSIFTLPFVGAFLAMWTNG